MATRTSSYHIPERFLRQLWRNQHFEASNLQTTDGRAVEILHPGIVNRDGGPDFRNARIRIGGILYRGSVELHQHNVEWVAHNHDRDPKYNDVVLHVVLHSGNSTESSSTKSNRPLPVLSIEPYLSSPYRDTWQKMILDERAERLETIKCYDINSHIETSTVRKWIEKLAVHRIELKVRRMEERLRELVDEQRLTINEPPPKYDEIPFGLNPDELPPPIHHYSSSDYRHAHLWDQLLYEGVMEALGYAKNQQSFLRLARNLRLGIIAHMLDTTRASSTEADRLESYLFNVAGLLPPTREMMDAESKHRITILQEIWTNARIFYHHEMLSAGEWQFFRLRPENFPTVRLAGAARLVPTFIHNGTLKSIIRIVKAREIDSREKFLELEELFIVRADEFWKHHYRFGEKAKTPLATLIGKSRADEIIINVLIPLCLLYARIFKDKEVRQGTLRIFEKSPPLSSNTIIQTMEKQLIRKKFALDSAMLQQGALQLYKFYCVEERCGECAVGKLVLKT